MSSLRNSLAGLALGAAALSGGAAIAADVAAPETVLHINAFGTVKPDTATITVVLSAEGKTSADAQRALDAKEVLMRKDFAALGDSKLAIKPLPNMDDYAPTVEYGLEESVRADLEYETRRFDISLNDLSKLSELMDLIRKHHRSGWARPQLSVSNPDKARDESINNAITQARSDAELVASRLGYRIVQLKGFGIAKPAVNLPDLFDTYRRSGLSLMGRYNPVFITTVTSLDLEYVIAPQ